MDIYEIITNKICDELDKGIIPWHKPWKNVEAVSYATKKPYSLLNQLLLGKGGEWLTFNQIHENGGHIRKGEKASMVVFWRWPEKEQTVEEDGETKKVKKRIPFLRYYNVWHIDQCEGITPKTDMTLNTEIGTDETADKLFTDYYEREGILVCNGGNEAYYAPMLDTITLPNKEQFSDLAEYYSTEAHEAVHSTGAEKRLNRDIKNLFGDKAYSKEELVAELGSAFILGRLGIDTKSTIKNSSAYIQSWKKRLTEDKHLIVSAAGKAEKATKYIYGELDTAEEGE